MNHFELEVEIAPNSDATAEEYALAVSGLSATIDELFHASEAPVRDHGDCLRFSCALSEQDVKAQLKPWFSHHFDIARFVAIRRI